jgi:quinoprotein glucose dehydrogenase
VKAVAQPTKQAFLYVFNRENGKPIWPMEERPVPQGDVPGEWYSPTQPFPTKPPAFDNQGVSSESLINFTPELHAEAEKLVSKYKIGPLFTPPSVSKAEGPLATIVSPGALGGANWPGGSYDPETHMLYVYSRSDISALGLVPSPDQKVSDMEYVQGTAGISPRAGRPMGAPPVPAPNPESGEPVLTVRGLPLLKPPYGRITAINLDKGEIVWQIAHGETPDNVRNNPALAGLTIPRTGSAGLIGVLTTKTLVIAGESVNVTMPSGMRGAMLRAYDKATGKDAGAVYMPAPQSGSPMTYMLNGQQYIVIAVSGPNYAGELIAYRLPAN